MSDPIRVYPHYLNPREHPDDSRRAVKPPSWSLFGNRTQFTSLRSFEVKDGKLVGFVDEIEKNTRTHALGDVVWPSYPVLFASNVGDLVDEIKRRNLFLFDIWGYVPGSGPGGYWQQFKAPPEVLAMFQEKLGDRWLGTDIGEQDGRYVNGYANQLTPASGDRFEQYLNFQRHFERMGDDLGHKHATLVSLSFGHYFLKEGTYTLIGAETAQALPNSQVYYAFIRGAGKQYGVPWFGNASVFNRWGYKNYWKEGSNEGYPFGPAKGTSLSLLKRLLYTHLFYNGFFAGFETGWLDGDQLTPVGKIQQSAQKWITQHGEPGVMHTPVALLLDFNAGWSAPRHLYSDHVYRVWGNLPYGPGDYLTDAILDLLYPGYQDSSYFHDESGFQSPTPFGDIADCVLTDAAEWALERYPLLVAAGELTASRELCDKLNRYLEQGGHLVITSGNLAKFANGLGGQTAGTKTATTNVGAGRLTVLASEFGISPAKLSGPIKSEIDRPLPKPFVLETEAREMLSDLFRKQGLFEVEGEGLSFVTCRRRAGEYTLCVANNTWKAADFKIRSRCGAIESVRELPIDTTERGAEGFLPEGVSAAELGANSRDRIAGGDVRVFAVTVKETHVRLIEHRVPPPRAQGRLLTLRNPRGLKEALLARPTFFAHFDGIVVDWKYVHERETAALKSEAAWLCRQGVRVVVDLSSGVNFYPGLRLLNTVKEDYERTLATLAEVLAKMEVLGARDLIVSLHRYAENNLTAAEADVGFENAIRDLGKHAAERGITVHLRMGLARPPANLSAAFALLRRVGLPNVKLAPSLALALARDETVAEVTAELRSVVGFWLVAAPRRDVSGELYDIHAPLETLGGADRARSAEWLKGATEVVFDGLLATQDEEYGDAMALRSVM